MIGSIAFGVLLFFSFFILAISQWNLESDSKDSITYFYYVKTCGILFMLTKNILFQPFFFILLASTKCTLIDEEGNTISFGYECKSQVHIILISLSIFVLIVNFFLGAIVVWLVSDDQPNSRLPWAHCRRSFEICRYIQKFVVPLSFFIKSSSESILAVETLGFILMSTFCLYQLYQQTYMGNTLVFYGLFVSEFAILWLNFIVFLNIVLDIDWSSPIMYALFVCLSFAVVFFMNENRLNEILQTHEIGNLKSMSEVETYTRILMHKVSKDNSESRSFIEETLMIHSIKCENSLCVCHRLGSQGKQTESNEGLEGEDSDTLEPKKEILKGVNGTGLESFEIAKKRKHLYRLIIGEITNWGESYEKNASYHIYLACLKLISYDNPLSALLELMYAKNASPALYDSFRIYRIT